MLCMAAIVGGAECEVLRDPGRVQANAEQTMSELYGHVSTNTESERDRWHTSELYHDVVLAASTRV